MKIIKRGELIERRFVLKTVKKTYSFTTCGAYFHRGENGGLRPGDTILGYITKTPKGIELHKNKLFATLERDKEVFDLMYPEGWIFETYEFTEWVDRKRMKTTIRTTWDGIVSSHTEEEEAMNISGKAGFDNEFWFGGD